MPFGFTRFEFLKMTFIKYFLHGDPHIRHVNPACCIVKTIQERCLHAHRNGPISHGSSICLRSDSARRSRMFGRSEWRSQHFQRIPSDFFTGENLTSRCDSAAAISVLFVLSSLLISHSLTPYLLFYRRANQGQGSALSRERLPVLSSTKFFSQSTGSSARDPERNRCPCKCSFVCMVIFETKRPELPSA
jgi:hypothetical protein